MLTRGGNLPTVHPRQYPTRLYTDVTHLSALTWSYRTEADRRWDEGAKIGVLQCQVQLDVAAHRQSALDHIIRLTALHHTQVLPVLGLPRETTHGQVGDGCIPNDHNEIANQPFIYIYMVDLLFFPALLLFPSPNLKTFLNNYVGPNIRSLGKKPSRVSHAKAIAASSVPPLFLLAASPAPATVEHSIVATRVRIAIRSGLCM